MELKTEIGIPWLIIMGVSVMLLLALAVIIFVLVYNGKLLKQKNRLQQIQVDHRKQLIEAVIQTQEKERQTMAHNIHDDIGSLLNTVKLNLGGLSSDTGPAALKESVDHLMGSVQTGIDQLRNLTKELLPPVLEKYGLKKALEELVGRINNAKQIKAEIVNFDTIVFKNPFVELQLYRMIQEIINNVIKHSAAGKVEISVNKSGNNLITRISHNGNGINNNDVERIAQTGTGLGLKSIMSRALVIAASVNYVNDNSKPYIEISLPYIHE